MKPMFCMKLSPLRPARGAQRLDDPRLSDGSASGAIFIGNTGKKIETWEI
jgi:hypothetical protein